MDEAIHAIAQFDEGTEGGKLGDRALHNVPDAVLLLDACPGVFRQLAHAEADSLTGRVDVEDNGIHFLPLFKHLAGMVDLPCPGHVRNMDHSIDVVLDLNKGAVRSHIPHLAKDSRSLGEVLRDEFPWVWLALTQAQRDLASLLLDVQHHCLHLIPDVEHVTGTVDLLRP